MRRRYLTFVVAICQFLISNQSFGFVTADPFECAIPVRTPLNRLRVSGAPFGNHFARRRQTLNVPVYTSEGVGEVFVSGDDLSTGGVTDVEGSVPVSGSVVFGGPVRASGTVTIAGRCGPARFSPLSIPPPLLPLQSFSSPFLSSPLELPTFEHPPPAFLPKASLPPIIIPALVIPAYVFPEVSLPACNNIVEIESGCGDILVAGDDIYVCGVNNIDAVLPTVSEINFESILPTIGTVTIL